MKDLPPPPCTKRGWPWTEETSQLPNTAADGSLWPAISIITPSFNQGKFIEETIRSVLLQGYPNLEYIIIDGGSTDNSVEVIKKYAQWLSFWVSEKDGGQSDAINKGWKRANGEILAYLNSDDLYTPGAIAEVSSCFRKYPSYTVVHGQTIAIDENGNEKSLFGSDFDLVASLNGCNNYIAQPSAFIHRRGLMDVGLMDRSLHKAMDYDLWLRLALKHKFYHVARPWSKFRVHPDSKTHGNITLRSDCLPIMRKLYASRNVPKDIQQLKNIALAWASLFRAQMYCAERQPFRARWYALKGFMLDKSICLKFGKGLFLEILLSRSVFNRMRKIKKTLAK